jgi:alpha-D-xyloside xylohydrolase
MFPKWSFGLFQSQDRYKSQAEVLSVKNNYRKNNIPIDCIVQDWFYWEPDVIGSHIMWPERYPDPKAMVDELHKANVHAMISIWPVFAKGTKNYDAMAKAGNLTTILWDNAMTHTLDNYYDAHNPKAREMYWRQADDCLIAPYGWDAWWVDQCEPDNGDLLNLRRQSNFSIGRGIDYFNTYSLMHSTGLYSNWRNDVPGKRAFFLIRQAFAGQQRNSITLWSSDITCTWRAYKSQVPQAINSCASGIPYWTSDIGGYHLHWQAPDWSAPVNREMFTRWFQFGTFSPIFRIHGKGERALFSENWDANTKTILLKYDNLRYRLMPYIYSLSWKVTSEAYTILRALAFDFRMDSAINNIPDQYMFGPAILVNPVTEQMYSLNTNVSAEKTRKVYLPKAANWFDFWTGKTLSGGQTINASAPLETIPLFIKAGSIVPMGPFLQYATEKLADSIELRVYPGADGQFTLYEDQNDNYNYEKGVHSIILIQWNESKKTLTIGKRAGTFPGMLKKRTFHIVWVREGHGSGLDPEEKPDMSISYDGKEVKVSQH